MFDRLRGLFGRDPDIPPVALVTLETTWRLLSGSQIAAAVTKATGEEFSERKVSLDRPNRHRFTVAGYELTLLTIDRPYIPKDREPNPIPILRETVERHEAAVLLDAWKAPRGKGLEEGTDLMGRILVELFDETSVGVYSFHTQRLNPIDGPLIAMFREGKAFEAMKRMTFSNVVGVHRDDERMQAAVAEARRRWPEFVAAFDRRGPSAAFGFKAPFAEDDRVEHLWIDVETLDLKEATGTVSSRPYALSETRQGDRVSVPAAHISDWAFRDGEVVGGGFSRAAMAPSENS